MNDRYRTRAVVLTRQNQGEADQVLTFYTDKFGKIKILGKSIRKIQSKLRGSIQVCLSEIEFVQGRNYGTLTDVRTIKSFNGISNDFRKLGAYFSILRILDRLIKGREKDSQIWSLLIEALDKLNKSNIASLVYYYFFWNLCLILGYGPDLYQCASCRNNLGPKIYFREWELVCSSCSSGSKIDVDLVKILRLIFKKDWNILERLKINSNHQQLLERFSEEYCLHVLE